MAEYEEKTDPITGYEYIEKTEDDGIIRYIPKDEKNKDYQEYLESL